SRRQRSDSTTIRKACVNICDLYLVLILAWVAVDIARTVKQSLLSKHEPKRSSNVLVFQQKGRTKGERNLKPLS
ncbi:MAG: hypothetical protein K2Z81_10115, partial [Cyanobacteria bacterium]|nr:hypothetical protein [Cyanobacteriota bacterium]